jgi:hypothetical protein
MADIPMLAMSSASANIYSRRSPDPLRWGTRVEREDPAVDLMGAGGAGSRRGRARRGEQVLAVVRSAVVLLISGLNSVRLSTMVNASRPRHG